MFYGMRTVTKYMVTIWAKMHGKPPATEFNWIDDVSDQMVTSDGDNLIFSE